MMMFLEDNLCSYFCVMHLLYFFFYSVSQVDILIYTFEEEITIIGNVIDIIITQLSDWFLHLILHLLELTFIFTLIPMKFMLTLYSSIYYTIFHVEGCAENVSAMSHGML